MNSLSLVQHPDFCCCRKGSGCLKKVYFESVLSEFQYRQRSISELLLIFRLVEYKKRLRYQILIKFCKCTPFYHNSLNGVPNICSLYCQKLLSKKLSIVNFRLLVRDL